MAYTKLICLQHFVHRLISSSIFLKMPLVQPVKKKKKKEYTPKRFNHQIVQEKTKMDIRLGIVFLQIMF